MEIFLFWVILSILVGVWANSRGHSGVILFFASLLLSPLIGFLIEAVQGRNTKAIETAAVDRGEMRKCPACAEFVKAEAIKCRYCGEALAAQPEATAGAAQRVCSNCKATMSFNGTHCGACGEALGVVAAKDDGAVKGWGG